MVPQNHFDTSETQHLQVEKKKNFQLLDIQYILTYTMIKHVIENTPSFYYQKMLN